MERSALTLNRRSLQEDLPSANFSPVAGEITSNLRPSDDATNLANGQYTANYHSNGQLYLSIDEEPCLKRLDVWFLCQSHGVPNKINDVCEGKHAIQKNSTPFMSAVADNVLSRQLRSCGGRIEIDRLTPRSIRKDSVGIGINVRFAIMTYENTRRNILPCSGFATCA